jgi:3-hydroxy-D-aspartate aldolase
VARGTVHNSGKFLTEKPIKILIISKQRPSMRALDTSGFSPNAALIGDPAAKMKLQTPALILDLESLEANIAFFAKRAANAGVALRPHTKGGKSAEIARRQLKAGATGICCATLGEAEIMASNDIGPILITSPVATAQAAARLITLARKAPGLMIVVDDLAGVTILAEAALAQGLVLPVLVEADVGQGRTGARSAEEVVAVAVLITKSASLRFAGLQAYYGHLQHVPTLDARKAKVHEQIERLRLIIEQLKKAGLMPEIVTGGGTGTFDIDVTHKIFTDIQAGSYPFMDRQYSGIEFPSRLKQALFVAAHVISANQAGLAIVNAGLKAFATEGGPPAVVWPDLAATYRFMGDEHGGLAFEGKGPRPGSLIVFQPPHCDPTINLYDAYHVFSGDRLVDIWPVDARGK